MTGSLFTATASMKVPPKRKGNSRDCLFFQGFFPPGLNESPSEKEGKFGYAGSGRDGKAGLNESPSEKEGKFRSRAGSAAPRKRLNESPSEKEGK